MHHPSPPIAGLLERNALFEVRAFVAGEWIASDIGDQVHQINGFMGQIATSSQEQASGIAAINSAVANLDQITQQNAAMAEQSSAATQKLSADATDLADLVSGFKLEQDFRHNTPVPVYRSSIPRPSPAREMLGTLKRRIAASDSIPDSWEEF